MAGGRSDGALSSREGTEPATEPAGAPWAVVAIAMALAAVSLLTVLVVLSRSGTDEELREEALEAARAATISLTSYDHRTLDADIARVEAVATGEFEAEYEQTSASLRPVLEQTQAVATATVPAAGLESLETDPVRAVVVLAVDQVIQTVGAPPRTEFNRIRMTLVRPDDTWLIEKVQRL